MKRKSFWLTVGLWAALALAVAKQASVNPKDCVVFKLDRNGQRTEIVLVKLSTLNPALSTGATAYRLLRCNNVPSTTQLSA